MDLQISEKELEFLNLLFRKSKGQVLHNLKKTKDATRSSGFNLLQEVIFGNCNALARDTSTTSCFCITRADTDIEFLECITEMVRSGLLRSLFKMCKAKIEQLPDPRKQPDQFVDDLFSLFFHCTQISSGQFSLNPNSEKKFMHTNELTVNSTSSSSTPSEAKYYADESESEKSPAARKITSPPPAKNTKRLRKRDPTRSSIPVVAQQKVKQIPPIKLNSDDHAYLADVESVGSGPLKTSTELDKWAAIYRMLKEDLREEFADKKEMKPSAPAAISTQPKSILKKPTATRRAVQPIESTAKPAPVRLKTSLTPIRPLSQHSAQARMLENLPNELLINLKQSQGLKSKPGSLKSEQIKLVLARNQELEKNRIHNIESTRRLKEVRLAEVKVNKRSEQLERKTKGQLTRQERTEMAKIKRQMLMQQHNKIFQTKGII